MGVFSVTERGDFRRCRERWNYGSYNRLSTTTIVGASALELGTLVHKALADWVTHPTIALPDLFRGHALEAVERARALYLANVGAPISDSELDPLLNIIPLGLAMMEQYQTHWGSPLPEDFDIISPEQTIYIPIPSTQHDCEACRGTGEKMVGPDEWPCPLCNGTGQVQHQLEATFDGLLKHRRTGALYILEHKTFSQHPKVEQLNLKDQFLAYLWALQQLDIGPVGGIAYDGIWKRDHVPKGRTLADLFFRTLLTRNAHELAEFEQRLPYEVGEMANPDVPIYHNRTDDCLWDCSFYSLCLARSRGEDTQYILDARYTKRVREAQRAAG
jgi:hypothetical protein